jgi:hypothetical protein
MSHQILLCLLLALQCLGHTIQCSTDLWFQLFSHVPQLVANGHPYLKEFVTLDPTNAHRLALKTEDVMKELAGVFQNILSLSSHKTYNHEQYVLTQSASKPEEFVLSIIGEIPDLLVSRYRDGDDIDYSLPSEFVGDGKCMKLRGTMQGTTDAIWVQFSDGHTWHTTDSVRPVTNPLTSDTRVVVYSRDASCDVSVSEQLPRSKEELKTAVAKRKQFLSEDESCSVSLSEDAICKMKEEVLRELDFLERLADTDRTDIPAGKQLAKLNQFILMLKTNNNATFIQHWYAWHLRAEDPDRPTVFINKDGSCFINSILQLLFTIPGIDDHIAAMSDGKVKTTLKTLLKKKREGEAVLHLTDFRDALDKWNYCAGGSHERIWDGFKELIDLMPTLAKSTRILNYQKAYSIGWSVGQFLRYPENANILKDGQITTVVLTRYALQSDTTQPSCPPVVTLGDGSKWELIATTRAEQAHSTSTVKVLSVTENNCHKWYYLSDADSSVINRSSDSVQLRRVVVANTESLVLQREAESSATSGTASCQKAQTLWDEDIDTSSTSYPSYPDELNQVINGPDDRPTGDNRQNRSTRIIILIVIAILALLSLGAYYFYQARRGGTTSPAVN